MKILLVCLCFVFLTVFGSFVADDFFRISLDQLRLNRVPISIQSTTMSGQFALVWLFALSLGILPVFYAIIRKLTKRPKFNDAFLIFSIMIGSGFLVLCFRILILKMQIAELTAIDMNGVMHFISVDHLKFSEYFFFGVCLGAIAIFSFFKWGFRSKALQESQDVEL